MRKHLLNLNTRLAKAGRAAEIVSAIAMLLTALASLAAVLAPQEEETSE